MRFKIPSFLILHSSFLLCLLVEIAKDHVVLTVRLKERHGIENLTLPDGNVISLIYDPKDGRPMLKSAKPIKFDYVKE